MGHAHDECRNRSLPKKSIAVPILVAHRTASIMDKIELCDCSKILTPPKLVYPDNLSAWREVPPRTVEVSILRSDQYKPGFMARPSPTRASKLVFVFWSSPNEHQAWRFSYFWTTFLGAFLSVSIRAHYSRDITIVNVESAVSYLQLDGHGDRSPCEIAAEDTRKQILVFLNHFGSDNPLLDEIRSTKFTFVTMKDYLANYDWRGEFTDDEVRPWLEHRE
jgi:hypothetical protein